MKTEHAEVEGIPVVWVAPAGEPTGVALWLTHLDAYRRDVAISFQCGGADQHVPADGAIRFRDALGSGDRIRVDVHPGLSHLDAARDEHVVAHALDWLTDAGDPY